MPENQQNRLQACQVHHCQAPAPPPVEEGLAPPPGEEGVALKDGLLVRDDEPESIVRQRSEYLQRTYLMIRYRWFAIIALAGGLLAITLFWLISVLINDYFAREAGQLQGLSRLLPWHLLVALAATLASAMLAAGLAAFRSTRAEPARGLREL